MRHIKISLVLILATVPLLFSYTNCIRQQGSAKVVSTGNPMDSTRAGQILSTVCTRLNSCLTEVTVEACRSSILVTSGLAESLGANPGRFATYASLMATEQTGAITANAQAVEQCLPQISQLDCGSELIQGSYIPGSTSPFAGVASLLSHPSMSCAGSFVPPILVGGSYKTSSGELVSFFAGLLNDGTPVESSFIRNPTPVVPKTFLLIENYQPITHYSKFVEDDYRRVLVAGDFLEFAGHKTKFISRIVFDGSLVPDVTFTAFQGYEDQGVVTTTVPMKDGRVYWSGKIAKPSGAPEYVGRLMGDGTPDPSFQIAGTGFDGVIRDMTVDSQGRLVATGAFRNYNGISREGIARLLPDGTLDPTFTTSKGGFCSTYTNAVRVDAQDRVYVAGWFTCYENNYVSGQNVVRLNSDGSLDKSFNPYYGPNNTYLGLAFGPTFALSLDKLGRTIVGGRHTFPMYNNAGITRFTPEGAYDPTLKTSYNLTGYVYSLNTDNNNRPVVGGTITKYDSRSIQGLTRLLVDGKEDLTFNFDQASEKLCAGTGCTDFQINAIAFGR